MKSVHTLSFSALLFAAIALPGPAIENATRGLSPSQLEFDSKLVEVQDKMFEVIDPIRDLVLPTDDALTTAARGISSGYAGEVLDLDARELTFYWSDEPDHRVMTIIKEAPAGITVKIAASQYSIFELSEAARSLMLMRQREDIVEYALTRAGPASDGSGLIVGFAGDLSEGLVAESLKSVTSVNIVRAEREASISGHDARWSDSSPFTGGAGYFFSRAGSTSFCSTGFSVESSTGNRYMLSAYHCFVGLTGTTPVSNELHTWGEWRSLSTRNWPEYDTTLIRPYSQSVEPDMFVGNFGGSLTYPVARVGGNSVGAVMCASGANSGLRCNLEVTGTNQQILLQDTGEVVSVVAGSRNTASGYTTVGGDSGGPIYRVMSSGRSAAGIIVGGSNVVSCGSSFNFYTSPQGLCTSNTFWAGAATIEEVTGLDILTD